MSGRGTVAWIELGALVVRRAGQWWLGELAGLLPPRLRPAANRIAVRRAPDGRAALDSGAPGSGKPVTLVLDRRFAFVVALDLPLAAIRHLRSAAGLQIDQVTPFHADDVAWDVRIDRPLAHLPRLRAALAVVPKADLAAILAAAGTAGLTAGSLTLDEQGGDPAPSRFEFRPDAARERRRRWRQRLAAAAVLAAAVVGARWALEARLGHLEQALEQQIADLRPVAEAAAAARRAAERRERPLRLWREAGAERTIDVLLELTRVLPDGTTAMSFARDGARLSLQGMTDDATALIGALERAQRFDNVRFAAPVTRQSGGVGEQFSLTADIVARPPGAGSDE